MRAAGTALAGGEAGGEPVSVREATTNRKEARCGQRDSGAVARGERA